MIRRLLAAAAMAAAFALTGNMAFEDAQRDHDHKCSMIEAGAWPAEVEPSCGGSSE